MSENILVNNFSAGWCPSDDEVNGRPNALLRMTNLELDQNGALQLIHGTEVLWSGYSGAGFRMFSRFIGSNRFDYVACNDGTVYRNNNLIASGGNDSIAAFGTAFNYTLIASGPKLLKDNGFTSVNLGIGPPTVAPTVTQSITDTPTALIGDMSSFGTTLKVVTGSASEIIGTVGNYIQCVTDIQGNFAMQSVYTLPNNANVLTGAVTGLPTDDDIIVLNGYIAKPAGVQLEFDVLLQPGDSAGDVVSNMYSFTVADLSKQAIFDSYTGQFTLNMPRSQFSKIGNAAVDWSTTYGFRLSIMTNNPAAAPTDINIWGAQLSDLNFTMRGGSTVQNGTYQYAQVNVNDTGSYIAKSILGPASAPVTINGLNARVTVQTPTDPQCNQVWIYRTGGNLDGTWYRVAVVTGPPFVSPIIDTMGDQDALNLNITIDPNLISVAQIADNIFEIVGPIQGRWYYFTSSFMYPSDIDDPDLVNASISVRVSGSSNEVIMWARNVSASVVLVGTTVDCYLLTGTFATFPDGTIDVYYQPLGVKFPPITFDAEAFGGAIYYLAADGWRFVLPTSFGTAYSSQNNQSMVAPNLDTLYRSVGRSLYNYAPPIMPTSPGSERFPICIAKNKMWVFPAGTSRGETWDFLRQYWRAYAYGTQSVSACVATQDNKVLVFCSNDNKVREYDYQGTKLIDFTSQQSFDVRFTYKDGGKPRQRKDIYTFKTRCYTGVGFINLFFTDEQQNFINVPSNITSATVTSEAFVDLAPIFNPFGAVNPLYLPKSLQVQLQGTSDDVVIQDWSLDFDSRPVPLTFLKIYPSNFGSATQKRLRTWPLVIDTLGNDVLFTPDVDGVAQVGTHFNSNYKKTVFHYFVTDVFGIDYGGSLHCTSGGMMEVWDTGTGQLGSGLQPNIVQNLPISTEFDQVGPLEIFRFGKILRMALRVSCPLAGPIPFSFYIDDNLIYQDQINANQGEDDYIVDLPKGVSGRILRVIYGPCNFAFSRYYTKFQVAISGSQQDTELRWLTVPGITSTLAQGI